MLSTISRVKSTGQSCLTLLIKYDKYLTKLSTIKSLKQGKKMGKKNRILELGCND